MKRIRALLALTALATSSLFALAPDAHAQIVSIGDPANDNGSGYDPRGDIVALGGNYTPGGIVALGITTRGADTLNSFDWKNGGTSISWDVATDGDTYTVFYYYDDVRIRNSNFDLTCHATPNAQPSGSGTFYSIGVSASCIGNPGWIRVRGFMHYGDGSATSSDMTSWTSEIYPIDAAPTTTTTQPAPTTTTTQPATQPVVHDQTASTAGSHSGYWMVDQSGQVYGFGSAPRLGNGSPNAVHLEPTPSGNGYWVLSDNGSVTSLGDASPFFAPGIPAGEKAVSLSSTPTGQGYWVFTDKGRVLTVGDAGFFGDMSGTKLSGPVLGSVATPSGKGYWMVASDGGIFAFGDATFHGSTGNLKLNKPVMAMAPAPDGSGYWLVASDGGIFAFDVPFYGSTGNLKLNKPISGIVAQPGGYMMVGQDGGIFSFGSVAFHGSLGANPPANPVVGAALQP